MIRRAAVSSLLLGLSLLASTRVTHAAPADALSAGFASPPSSAKPHTWWHWMNGNVTREGITADLEAMKRVGIGGAQMFTVDNAIPPGPVPYMSASWRGLTKFAIQEANRLGLELAIHNCAGWSSSGGPWITPQLAMQKVVTSETQVTGPLRFERVLAQPQTNKGFYRDIAVLAFPTSSNPLKIENLAGKVGLERAENIEPQGESSAPAERTISRANIVELSSRVLASGQLTWDVPAGNWTILRLGYTPTGETNHPSPPEGLGLESDKLSRGATDFHFAHMVQKVLDAAGPLAGKTLNNVLVDSYEVGAQNWTPQFRDEFRRRRGYDLLPFLPVLSGLVVENPQLSERFLWDFRRTIADLFDENYYDRFAELAHARGLLFSTEPYGNGNFDNLTAARNADIPMGEFWLGGAAMETGKLASSVAHTNGRKFVGAESFTSEEGWTADPYSLKAIGDRMYGNGINRFIFHTYAHQPWTNRFPGMTMGPNGTQFNRNNTWWNQSAAWMKYLARCQYLLQQGKFVGDVVFYSGENAPVGGNVQRDALPFGYDLDNCDTQTLFRFRVQNGRLVLPDGMNYRVLVLPPNRTMTPATLRKIRQLVFDGATIVGAPPQISPSLENYPRADAEVASLSREMWGANGSGDNQSAASTRALGKGRVFANKPISEVLAALQIRPDFAVASTRNNARLTYIHRVAGEADIYFVSNQRAASQQVQCTFRVAGNAPELWHPDSGQIERAPLYTQRGGETTVPLQLEPAGSIFVVFRRRSSGDHFTNVSRSGPATSQLAAPKLEIRRAVYEAADGASGSLDVTERVASLVADNTLYFIVENTLLGSDPASNHVKRLRLEYSLDGKPFTLLAPEHADVELPPSDGQTAPSAFEWSVSKSGESELRAWQPGEYSLQAASGKIRRIAVKDVLAPQEIGGAWDVRFPPNWGAPAAVTFPTLMSWTGSDVAGVRYFSGTATYRKTVSVAPQMLQKNRVLFLDLGRVKNLARVKLNGHDFGVLWKPPFRVDVSDVARVGANTLEVEITNLWPNRIIGDEQLPDDREWEGARLKSIPQWVRQGKPSPTGRLTFTTWRYWNRDSPLLESGLLGPVTLRAAQRVQVKP